MIRQTKTTLKELTAQYRGVLRHAFLTSVAVMGVAIAMPAHATAPAAVHADVGSVDTDITQGIIDNVVYNANTATEDGSYFVRTWDSTNHQYVDATESTTAAPAALEEAPTAADYEFTLNVGGDTNLNAYTSGYSITDPTATPAAYSIKDTPAKIAAYTYTKTKPNGDTEVLALGAGDVSANPVYDKTDYNYDVTTAYRVLGETTVNVEDQPAYSDYRFKDSGDNWHNLATYVDESGNLTLPNDLLLDITATTNAGNALNAYGADTTAYTTMLGRYNATNTAYGTAVGKVNSDQQTIDTAIATYRNDYGDWKAEATTYSRYTEADALKDNYESSLAYVINDKAATAATEAATAALATKANSADVYTKTEVDTAVGAKANSADVYTKTEVDTAVGAKANSADVYTKTEVDTAVGAKANSADVYTKTEANDLLGAKANAADVYTKTEAETIFYQKQAWVDSTLGITSSEEDAVKNALTGTIAGDETTFSGAINALDTQVSTNKTNIATNTANIATNAGNIAINAGKIATNTANIATNAENIATNAGNIAINAGKIATNTANIATNAENIAINTGKIATNTANIATNAANIATLDTKVGNVDTLTGTNLATVATPSVADHLTSLDAAIDANKAKAASDDALVLSKAMGYTDKLEENMSAGVASAVALSSVAVSNVKRGEVSVGGGYGYYNDQSALALGAAMGLSDRWSVNAGAGLGLKGSDNFSVRAGTNYKFKLF